LLISASGSAPAPRCDGACDEACRDHLAGGGRGGRLDYSYSPPNKDSDLTWDEATLAVYLKNPKGLVHGTKKSFPGLKSDEDIANVIAYLEQFGPDGKKR
jgi:cytochrome c